MTNKFLSKSGDKTATEVLHSLQNLRTIRRQSQRMLNLARQGKLKHFTLDEERMPEVVSYVLEVIHDQYPSLDIPYHSRWRHFEAGGINRIEELRAELTGLSIEEQGKIFCELVIISVLLDAGAGKEWRYVETSTRQTFNRSEGLAVASMALYRSGAFSAKPNQPLRVDAQPLLNFSQMTLEQGFQVTKTNPLTGVKGRLALLNRLGKIIKKNTNYFGQDGRLGNFYSQLALLDNQGSIAASQIFQAVLTAFGEIWPERISFNGVSLGDVWVYQALKSETPGSDLIPFHKLSQWLTYSLIETLEQICGLGIVDLDELTGLPEYRNGGLFLDLGLLRLKEVHNLDQLQAPDSEIIVEWRALTVALLDELAKEIRHKLKMNASELPLAKILQGGTWEAGRRIAKQKRSDGRPPLQIISDGTIF